MELRSDKYKASILPHDILGYQNVQLEFRLQTGAIIAVTYLLKSNCTSNDFNGITSTMWTHQHTSTNSQCSITIWMIEQYDI